MMVMMMASSRASSGGLLALFVALTIVLALVPSNEAFLDKLFKKPGEDENGNNNNHNKPELAGQNPSARGTPPSNLDYDSESDSEDEPDLGERSRPLPARDGNMRGAGKLRANELAESHLRRTKARQEKKSGPGKEAHGRTRRNQLRHAGKQVSSYLDEDNDNWHRDGERDERQMRDRVRHRLNAKDGTKLNWSDRERSERGGSRTSGANSGRDYLSSAYDEEEAAATSYDDHRNNHEDDEDENDDDEGYGDVNSRAQSKKDALAKAKYVSTGPSGRSDKSRAAREELLARINPVKPAQGTNRANSHKPIGAELVSGKFWKKGFSSVAKATGKGLKATRKALVALPKDMSNMVDSMSTFLEIDNRGKINAMDKRAAKAAELVRSEFAKFTHEWARINEEALDYLGDKNLDQISWDDEDMLDFRKDALHSLVISYEFIRLLIIWRENMLLAHEGFRLWLEKARLDCEQDKSLDIMTDFGYTPNEVYNYMLLMAWDFIKYDGLEPQSNLDYLMDLEDSRPKNYMSKFFRNIVILQEIYFPTMRALEEERRAVNLPSEDQPKTYDFLMDFRQMVAEGRFDDLDIEAPKELADVVARMTPQLRLNKLVYSKSHVMSLAAKLQQAEMNRRRGLSSIDLDDVEETEGEEEEEDDEHLYESDYEDE